MKAERRLLRGQRFDSQLRRALDAEQAGRRVRRSAAGAHHVAWLCRRRRLRWFRSRGRNAGLCRNGGIRPRSGCRLAEGRAAVAAEQVVRLVDEAAGRAWSLRRRGGRSGGRRSGGRSSSGGWSSSGRSSGGWSSSGLRSRRSRSRRWRCRRLQRGAAVAAEQVVRLVHESAGGAGQHAWRRGLHEPSTIAAGHARGVAFDAPGVCVPDRAEVGEMASSQLRTIGGARRRRG